MNVICTEYTNLSEICAEHLNVKTTVTNHKEHTIQRTNQSAKILNVAATRSAGKLVRPVTIGFGFTSDWLRKWREIFEPIAQRSNATYF